MISFYEAVIIVVVCLIAYMIWTNYSSKLIIPDLSKRRVLITGCDVGFGRLLTKRLDSMGLHVYAGCYQESSIPVIEGECSSRVKAVQLDVTNLESIQRAVQTVKDHLDGKALWGVVNNAGLSGCIAPFEFLNMADFRKVFDVNFFGVVSVTKEFLPLIRRGKEGRIVMVSSMLGRLKVFAEPYTGSKHALEGIAGGLNIDLYPFNITTHVLNPTFYKTALNNTDIQRREIMKRFTAAPNDVQKEYGEEFINSKIERTVSIMSSGRTNFDPLMDSFVHALTAVYPQDRYSYISPDSYAIVPFSWLPTWLQAKTFAFLRKMSGQGVQPMQMR